MSERCCYGFLWSDEYRGAEDKKIVKAEDCSGVLGTTGAKGYPEEGYYVEVCPRAKWLGERMFHIDFCGNGPDVIVLHRDTMPTREEIDAAAKEADDEW